VSRVVFFHEVGRAFETVDVTEPTLRGAELLVRIECCTLCTSDLHTHAGRRHGPTPTVLGHEIVGRVAAFGPDAAQFDHRGAPLKLDDRITWSVAASCGRCFYCADALPQKCERLHKYGHERATAEHPFVGGLADHIVLMPGTACMHVPSVIPDTLAASANCATATCAAVLRAAGPILGKRVLIMGAGVLGLTACAMARTAGAARVLVCDPDPIRRQRASAFGATDTLGPDDTDAVLVATERRGADIALELAGTHEAAQACLVAVRIGGTVVLAGTVLPTAAVALDPEKVVRRLLTIRGVHNYTPADLAAAVDFLAEHARSFPFDQLIGRSFGLHEVEQAFAHAHAHPGARVAIVP